MQSVGQNAAHRITIVTACAIVETALGATHAGAVARRQRSEAQPLRILTNAIGPRSIAGAGLQHAARRTFRGMRGYGFSTGSRTAFPHSVHDPS
jgi:hypothetical protein